jgi:hypothetical protein
MGRQNSEFYVSKHSPNLAALNLDMNVILNCYRSSQTFELRHIFKGFITFLYMIILSFSMVTRHEHLLRNFCPLKSWPTSLLAPNRASIVTKETNLPHLLKSYRTVSNYWTSRITDALKRIEGKNYISNVLLLLMYFIINILVWNTYSWLAFTWIELGLISRILLPSKSL